MVKIKILEYKAFKNKKGKSVTCDLWVPFTIENAEGEIKKSCAVIDMSNLSYFVGKIPMLITSFLYFAAIVYAIDRSVSRDKFSIDGWSRILDVSMKLPCNELFSEKKEKLEQLLSYLTGDYWCLDFEDIRVNGLIKFKESTYFNKVSQVNLFSGGLDSLIGAIDYMTQNPDKQLFLASHYDSDMGGPLTDQRKLLELFNQKFAGRFLVFPKCNAVRVVSGLSQETTCRSRSLIFIAIAMQVATYRGVHLEVPENGSVSLNYPLSASRRSSCSTRTTHPVVIHMLNELLEDWGVQSVIVNPYEFDTKGEMVKKCSDQSFLFDCLPQSNSCGKRTRHQFFYDNRTATHCGHCMPCMYRKAALVGFKDLTTYGNTLQTLFLKRTQQVTDDFYAMLNFLKKEITDDEIKKELRIAKVNMLPNFELYVDLVKRTRCELRKMIDTEGTSAIKEYIGIQ